MTPRAALAAALAALAAAGAGACTEADLYSPLRAPRQADRVAVAGRVCTEDPTASRDPVRLVLVVDQAAGPLYATFDPQGDRVGVLRSFVQSALSGGFTEVAVVRFAGTSRKLAPLEGDFTRNPGELLAALTQLTLPEPCAGEGQCRDYQDGLRTARSLVEGDLASLPAGLRVLTRYVVVLINAGPHAPLARGGDCCAPDAASCPGASAPSPACQAELDAALVADLRAAVEAAGAAGLELHAVHLAAEPDAATNDAVGEAMRRMAFAGGGRYARVAGVAGLDGDVLDVLDLRAPLRAKHLLVSNRQALPGPDGPVADSDGDGLADADEAGPGTDPTRRDTDGDGLGDLVEILVGFDPLAPDLPAACASVDAARDTDLDGLGDCDEVLLGADPSLVDTDGDALPDREEVFAGTDWLTADAEGDLDGDGLSNGDEIRAHGDPRSTDVTGQLPYAYRYEVVDEGVVTERVADPLELVTGVTVRALGAATTPGLGVLSWSETTRTLRWRDAGDGTLGLPVDVSAGGAFDLPSSSWAPVQGAEGRVLSVEVDPAALPPRDAAETVRVVERVRQCLTYTVRNIRLLATLAVGEGGAPGLNDVRLSFAEAPAGRLEAPGPFRLASVPVRFEPPDARDPPWPVLTVLDEEFVRPRLAPP